MPEDPVLKAWYRLLTMDFADGHDGARPAHITANWANVPWHIVYAVMFPRCFSIGTATKPYTTCTCDVWDGYTPHLDDPDEQGFPDYLKPSEHDLKRAKGQPYSYLVRPRAAARPYVANRGKALAIAVGYVRPIWYCNRGRTDTSRSIAGCYASD